jgi:hypothetical protein
MYAPDPTDHGYGSRVGSAWSTHTKFTSLSARSPPWTVIFQKPTSSKLDWECFGWGNHVGWLAQAFRWDDTL